MILCYGLQPKQPLLLHTVQVRSALSQASGPGGPGSASQRRKLSFRHVSNVAVQLLLSIKYSVEVPFSNIAPASSVQSPVNSLGHHESANQPNPPTLSLLPMRLDIVKAWSFMNAEFAADGHVTAAPAAVQPSSCRTPKVTLGETIELKVTAD